MGGKPHITILGAGPAGLGAAYQLTRQGRARVTVLEANPDVGGNAGSFELAGIRVDYGSHRLHPACDPVVLQDIRALLQDDLLNQPRHGRIRLRRRWIHFPLKPVDLTLRLPPDFAMGVIIDGLVKTLWRNGSSQGPATFASVMEASLGRTICHDFYFPYARKLWGLEPDELSAIQAQRRVKNNSLSKMLRKVLSAVPGVARPGGGRFFYPRHGYGQISDAYAQAAAAAGADIRLNARVENVAYGTGFTVQYMQAGQRQSIKADLVWSTIPITRLAQCLQPSPPPAMLQAAAGIDFRAMILIYLVLEQSQFSAYDAHYFPEGDIPISRMSEPKNYAARREPRNLTVLCAELPCMVDDAHWQQSDVALGGLVCQSLASAGIPLQAPLRQVATRRLKQAYPIYRLGYEDHFNRLDDWIGQIDGLLTFGRQGLFAHDNTHHALYMAYSAVDCLNSQGEFDGRRWAEFRRIFETHVVED